MEQATLKEDEVERGEPYVKAWYPVKTKFRKKKLGSFFHCQFKGQYECLCRVMNYDRISSYQIEAFFTELAKI